LFFAPLFALACATSGPAENPKPASSEAPQAKVEPPRGQAPKAPVPLDAYMAVRRVGRTGASFSFDEKWVAYASDQGGRVDIWVTPVGGGAPKQITHVNGFVHGQWFSPASDQLVFSADDNGDELAHLFLTNAAGDAPKDLNASDPKGSRADFLQWAEDGKTFLYLSSRRDPKYLDLYEYNVKTGKSELLWKSADKLALAIASRDGKRFIVLETLSDVDRNLYLVERAKKGEPKITLLTKHEGEIAYDAADFWKDGKTLYYTSDEKSDFTALYAMDVDKHTSKLVLKEDWDVEDGRYSHGWKYFVSRTNVDGTPKVVITNTKNQKKVELPGVPANAALIPFSFSKNDRYLAANLVSDSKPTTLVIVDLKEGRTFEPVEVLSPALRDREMVAGLSIRIPSFDDQKVPAFLYSPPGDGPFPAVIDVHGGPTSQSRREFNGWRQYLVSKGYVVLVPNVRGSTGYGKAYTKLDDLDLGGGPLQDIIACKKWLAKEAKVDEAKVAIMGGSYGGYMTLAAATFAPTEFAAHVDLFGVSDLKSLVESFPAYWAAFATGIYKKFGDPNNPEHAKYQHDRSPLNFVDKIERPLLVVQGDHDARVKKDQSDRVVEALKARKVPVHYLVLTGEGHGFSKNESRLEAFRASDRFLDRYLFNDPSIEVLPEAPKTEEKPANAAASNP
jgi:dipeptidyl aminopeptidase/acylaminoacyl peptidase